MFGRRSRSRKRRSSPLTGTRTRGGGNTLNLSAGAAAQLARLKQVQPTPAPIKIVRVPVNARPSSITRDRVVIPPAPRVKPPPRVNPPPRQTIPRSEPDYNPPQIRTAAQITGNTRNNSLQPRAVFETPAPFNTQFQPPQSGNLSNSALARLRGQTVRPPANIATRPIAIGGARTLVRGIPGDRGFTDEVIAVGTPVDTSYGAGGTFTRDQRDRIIGGGLEEGIPRGTPRQDVPEPRPRPRPTPPAPPAPPNQTRLKLNQGLTRYHHHHLSQIFQIRILYLLLVQLQVVQISIWMVKK
jgi:hypothetical protein